jgi:hypothetical protein
MEYSEQLQRWQRKQGTIVVWWTSEEDDKILSGYPSNFGVRSGWPEYLSKSFNNRIGRSTGARLLVAPPISRAVSGLDPSLDYTEYMTSAGVIMLYEDLWRIHGLPGRATYADLTPVDIPKEPDPRPLRPVGPQAIPPPPPQRPKPQYPLLDPSNKE